MISSEIAAQTADRVAAAIERSGASRLLVSEKTGIPRSTLNTKLKGVSEFTITEIVSVARAIDAPVYDLLPDTVRRAVAA